MDFYQIVAAYFFAFSGAFSAVCLMFQHADKKTILTQEKEGGQS